MNIELTNEKIAQNFLQAQALSGGIRQLESLCREVMETVASPKSTQRDDVGVVPVMSV